MQGLTHIAKWIACLVATQALAMGGEFRLESGGARFGGSLTSNDREFYQTEAFAHWQLPWTIDLGAGWSVGSRLDLTAGSLIGQGESGFVGSLGGSAVLKREELPLRFVLGSSPTGLSRDVFGNKDFGSLFQFTTHAGIGWQLGTHVDVSYRFQHMSNAGLASPNPGLNLHLFSVGYRF